MKRFRFNLEKLLELRRFAEEEAERELARAIGELSELERRLASLAEERAQVARERFSHPHSVAELRHLELYLLRLDQQKEKLLEAMAIAFQNVERARQNYLEASRDKRVVEKLKEKKQAQYKKELFKEETRLLDDLGGRKRSPLSEVPEERTL